MSAETIVWTEYGVDYGDEVEGCGDSLEEARYKRKNSIDYYTKYGMDLSVLGPHRVMKRTVIETYGEWEEVNE